MTSETTDKYTGTGLRVPRSILISDAIAGLVMAIITIPGALANGLLAGVNPVFGLYSIIAGTSVAALFTSAVIMNVDSTSATSLATFEVLGGVPAEEQLGQLMVLGLLVGLFMLLFGFLKLGFLVRFISNSVMTGFLSGLGVLTILGQLGDLTSYYSDAPNKVFQAIDVFTHPGLWDYASLFVGLLTIVTILLADRTRFQKYSFAIGIVVATVFVAIANPESVAIVGDTAEIPRSLPIPKIPDFSLILGLLLPALTIAMIALVQAAGVSSSISNPDGEYPDPSRDFIGQGAGNVATGLVGGIPVGGSLSGTFLIRNVGGRSRWANIFTGLFTAVAILLISPQIESIPMSALAGLLILVGASMIKVPRIETVLHTGWVPTTIMTITFLFTLFVPLQYAVALGVALHILVYVFRSSEAVRLERVMRDEEGRFYETDVPEVLSSNETVALIPIGSLFFAGAAEFEEELPDIGDASRSVVIISLRDKDEIGSTFVNICHRYGLRLEESGNKLKLTGMNDRVMEQLENTDLLDAIGEEDIYPGTKYYGEALTRAMDDAETWITEAPPAENQPAS